MRDRRLRVLIAGLLVALLSAAAIPVDRLRGHVAFLSAPDLLGRRSGQPGALKAAQYIFDRFKEAGFEVRMQGFGNDRRNVVARLGSADRHIVLGAHYDGQGRDPQGRVHPSASDNATGVAALIELARDLRALNLPVSLVVIAFDDEEQGLNGSNFYVDNPIFPLEHAEAAIIFDTMGRHFLDLKKSTLFVLGSEYSRELTQVVTRRGRPDMLVAGVDLIGPRSDFAGFARKKVPFLFFSHATHKDYHGVGDRPELVDYDSIAQDLNLIERMIADVAQSPGRPDFREQPVYQAREPETLLQVIRQVRQEKQDLPMAYQMVLTDLEQRLRTDRSRATMNVAASTLLAAATPAMSSFLLEFIVAPAYQKENKPEIAKALLAEAARSNP